MVWYPKKGFEAFGLTLLIEGKYIESTFFKCLFSLFCSVICNLFGALDWEMGCSLCSMIQTMLKKNQTKRLDIPLRWKNPTFLLNPSLTSSLINLKFSTHLTFEKQHFRSPPFLQKSTSVAGLTLVSIF